MSSRRTALAWVAAMVCIVLVIGLRLAIRDKPLDRLQRTAQADGSVVHRGSWFFPRGGPYVLGFDSPAGNATLSIDGRVVARGRSLVKRRVVYPAKVAAVELIAPPGTRLLWHPPGRRGPLEYVAPSSLSPRPPEQAQFDSSPGAARLDGGAAMLVVIILLAAVAYSARRSLAAVSRREWVVVFVVVAVALIARLWSLDAAGATWDEDVNWSAGRNYVINLLELDFARDSWQWNFEHPPFTKYIAGVGALLADGYGPARALSALVVSVACAFLVAIVRRLYCLEAALFAGLAAALAPHLIAHGKVVGHEATAVLWWTVALWAALRVADCPRDAVRMRVARITVVGIIVGIAVFSRFVNALLGPLVWSVILLYTPKGQRLRVAVLAGIIIAVAVAVVGYVSWPRLWLHPIDGLFEAWDKLKRPHGAELYLGSSTKSPPAHYFPVYLMATAPLLSLGLAWAWAFTAVVRRRRADLVLLFWMLAPLVVALSPVRQDGVRYIMPSVVALAVASGIGAQLIAARLRRHARSSAAIMVVVVVGYLGVTAARIHPYYLDYYGEHVGGSRGVYEHRALELAWWGEGLDRAVEYINRHADEGAAVYKACVVPSHLTWLRHDLWAKEARRPERASWILVYQPYTRRCRVPAGAHLVFEVDAGGAPLARVYRRDAD